MHTCCSTYACLSGGIAESTNTSSTASIVLCNKRTAHTVQSVMSVMVLFMIKASNSECACCVQVLAAVTAGTSSVTVQSTPNV
jgi:hypothetical protein